MGELSGVWVVEMAGGVETEAGESHQTSLEDEGVKGGDKVLVNSGHALFLRG